MRNRILPALVVAVLAAGCSVGNGNEEALLDDDVPTPDTTPFVEQATPNAETDVDRPDVPPSEEDAVPPEDNELGTSDGEQ